MTLPNLGALASHQDSFPPLFSPRSALGPTLVHAVQTKGQSPYIEGICCWWVMTVCLVIVSHCGKQRVSLSPCDMEKSFTYWVFFLQGIIFTATVFPPWPPGPCSLCEYSYLTYLQPLSPTGIQWRWIGFSSLLVSQEKKSAKTPVDCESVIPDPWQPLANQLVTEQHQSHLSRAAFRSTKL